MSNHVSPSSGWAELFDLDKLGQDKIVVLKQRPDHGGWTLEIETPDRGSKHLGVRQLTSSGCGAWPGRAAAAMFWEAAAGCPQRSREGTQSPASCYCVSGPITTPASSSTPTWPPRTRGWGGCRLQASSFIHRDLRFVAVLLQSAKGTDPLSFTFSLIRSSFQRGVRMIRFPARTRAIPTSPLAVQWYPSNRVEKTRAIMGMSRVT